MRETSSRKSRIPVRIKAKFVLKDGVKLAMQSKTTEKVRNATTSFERRVNDKIAEVSLESSLATSGSSLVTQSTYEHVSIETLDDSFDVNYTRGVTSKQSQTGRQCYDGVEASAGVELAGTTNLKPEECDPLKSAYHEEEKDGVEPPETNDRPTNELEKDEVTHESRYEKASTTSVPVSRSDTIATIAPKKQKPSSTSSKQRSRRIQSVDVVPRVNKRRTVAAADRERKNRVWHVGSGSGTVRTRYGIVCDENIKSVRRVSSNESVIIEYRTDRDGGEMRDGHLVVPEITVVADVCHSATGEINIGESGDLKFLETKEAGENVLGSTGEGADVWNMLDKWCENVTSCEDGDGSSNGSGSEQVLRLPNGDQEDSVLSGDDRFHAPEQYVDQNATTMSIDCETQSQDSSAASAASRADRIVPRNLLNDPASRRQDLPNRVDDENAKNPTWKSENFDGRASDTNYDLKTIPDASRSVRLDPCASDAVPETTSTTLSSIRVGVDECATTLSCSLACTAKPSAGFASDSSDSHVSTPSAVKNCPHDDDVKVSDAEPKREQLCWSFRNGRLVFDAVDEEDDIIYSKDVNKRPDEGRSRLKRLECKLKEAGVTDLGDGSVSGGSFRSHAYDVDVSEEDSTRAVPKYIDYRQFQSAAETKNSPGLDSNRNVVNEDDGDRDDLIPDDTLGFSQFDVSRFPGFADDDDDDDECSGCEEEDEEHYIVIRRGKMRGDGNETAKHNPDRDNLKSLLKKPGRGKEKKPNRVVFNETKNEFFDADYIILIREECDYDDEDDDGVCTCNQHEIVRLTCCEPNCNCNQGYDGFDQTPPSPKFAPPIEFVDAVTLSPPEGYKDLELGEEQLAALQQMARRSQRTAVCRECSASHEEAPVDDGDGSQSDGEIEGQTKEQEEKEKTDQSQQTTPTTPPNSESPSSQKYILETVTMTTVTQQQILREAGEDKKHLSQNSQFPNGSPIAGILKGGRLWKQQSNDGNVKISEQNLANTELTTSDDEAGSKRSVRFIETAETKEKRDVCDGAAETSLEEGPSKQLQQESTDKIENAANKHPAENNSSSPESTEMMLTFKLGSHVLISNNSLKPNSAVRQLFPCAQSLAAAQGVGEEENSQQYLVTAESLRAFEEAKRSKLPQIVQNVENDENIKRAIERNTLRRSLIRYEPRSKKQAYKTDNSLVERIKQLTCDVDDNVNRIEHQPSESSTETSEDVPDSSRSSPPGEESRNSPDVSTLVNKNLDKSFSPSSSSTSSSNSSSMSSASNYHHLRTLSSSGDAADGKHRMDTIPDIQNNYRRDSKPLPDIGGPHNHEATDPSRPYIATIPDLSHCAISNKISSSSTSSESRRQFLSTLAPLTACVSMGIGQGDDYYYHLSNNQPCDRVSVASSGTEYSLEDIDEGLKNDEEEDRKRIAPDVLVGTPSASESGDELALFVQQDAGRIERIKKKYHPVDQQQKERDDDDEHDDYGFNRRPSVRGIKPRFGTTTEILQQIQNQLQPPLPPTGARMAWPYYSETDNSKQKNANAGYHYGAPQYRPTSLQDESLYQNCANQRCVSRDVYQQHHQQQQRGNANVYSSMVRVGNEYYHSVPRQRNGGRPQSPPPMDMSKSFHQTMVYIPYNHIEGYQPVAYYHHAGNVDYVTRVSSQNQINKRYVEPIYQSRTHHHHSDEHHYNSNAAVPPVPPKPTGRGTSYHAPPHLLASSRSESPLPGQFSTARSTQTSCGGYYPAANPRYRPMINPVWPGEANYVTKMTRHSFPSAGVRYSMQDSTSLTDSDSTHSGSLANGYRQQVDQAMGSPTRPRFIERGVPEGAASVQPQDLGGGQSNSGTMTSPTSPQNPPVGTTTTTTTQKPMFYAMNV